MADTVRLYHGLIKIRPEGSIAFDLPEPCSFGSAVALHFNRTNQVLYLIRAEDFNAFDQHPTLRRLPDRDDKNTLNLLDNAQKFMDAAKIERSSERVNLLPWDNLLRRLMKRTIHPIFDSEDIDKWLQRENNLTYVDVPKGGEDL